MQQRKESSITEIKIPRSYLQNPKDNAPLITALSNDLSLKWIGDTIEKIANEKIVSYDIVVDDPSLLYPGEVRMLVAIRKYCTDHVNEMRARDSHLLPKSTSLASSTNTLLSALSAADPASEQAPVADTIPAQQTIHTTVSAAAAAVAAATTETIAETVTATAAATTATTATTAAAVLETSAAAAATTATSATSATTAASTSATAVNTLTTEHLGTTDDLSTSDSAPDQATSDSKGAPTLPSPLLADTTSTENKVLAHVRAIISLEIWARKGKGMLGYSDPDGINKMKKVENATLDDFFKIARDKHCQSGFSTSTRANMTGRFYEMLFTLQQPANTAIRLRCLQEYAKQELIINYNSNKNRSMLSFGKVVLSDGEINTLCLIAGIQPKDIEALANSTAAAAATAAAAVSSSSDANTATDADEELQTGLRR